MALNYDDPPQSWAQNWTTGTGNEVNFPDNGSDDENTREYGLNPWRRRAVIWKCTPNGLSYGGDGGWNSDSFAIDNSYTYRFSCWFRRDVYGTKGRAYFGTHGYGDTNGIYEYDDDLNTNPYFWYSGQPADEDDFTLGEWHLVVGHVFKTGTTLSTSVGHSQSGVWNLDGTKKRNIIRDFIWHSDSTTSNTRSYLYYCDTDTDAIQYMAYPRADKCDGTEPELQALLRHGRSFLLGNILLE